MTTAAEKAAYERCHRRLGCEAGIVGVCRRRNEHAHHRQMRSQRGPTVDENLAGVCRPCHDFIHAHPNWSYRHGLLVPSWADYLTTEITSAHSLDCELDHASVSAG